MRTNAGDQDMFRAVITVHVLNGAGEYITRSTIAGPYSTRGTAAGVATQKTAHYRDYNELKQPFNLPLYKWEVDIQKAQTVWVSC